MSTSSTEQNNTAHDQTNSGGSSGAINTEKHGKCNSDIIRTDRKNLCKQCELHLRMANFFVNRVPTDRGHRVRSCDICHTSTYCGLYDVSGHKTRKRVTTTNNAR